MSYHKPSMNKPHHITHRTRSGMYWVGVCDRGQPVTKFGCSHPEFDKALTCAVRLIRRFNEVAVFERVTGRVMWDSKHGCYALS